MRKFPKPGFYVYNVRKWCESRKLSADKVKLILDGEKGLMNVVYASGTTKGNFYYDPEFHGDQWNKLLWTCVPALAELESCYDYHENNPTDKEVPK